MYLKKMKKSEKSVKVKLSLPKEVLKGIISSDHSRMDKGKLLLLSQYYYNSESVVDSVTLNKFIGVKDSKGKKLRMALTNMGIIQLTEKASYAKGSNGQFYRRGYDLYIGTFQSSRVDYTLLSTDAKPLTGTYSSRLLEVLDLLAIPAAEKDITKYEQNKIKYTNNELAPISGDLLKVIQQQNMSDIKEDSEDVNLPNENTPLIADLDEIDNFNFGIEAIFNDDEPLVKIVPVVSINANVATPDQVVTRITARHVRNKNDRKELIEYISTNQEWDTKKVMELGGGISGATANTLIKELRQAI